MRIEGEYSIGNSGRVKAAGVPMDTLFDPADGFRRVGGINEAQEATEEFSRLRKAPPNEVRDRFFPRDRVNKGMFRGGPLLVRPILKTDQGAGQFLPFDIDGRLAEEGVNFSVAYEEGYCIPETFFERQLRDRNYPTKVMNALGEVRVQFRQLNIPEAQLAYERLQLCCEEEGITYQRDNQVGRDALFFIRPAASEGSIVLSGKVMRSINETIGEQVGLFRELAHKSRREFTKTNDILTIRPREINLPPYFQADIQVMPNGEVVIDQVQLPDVGLFLSNLDSGESVSLSEVQERVVKLREGVFGSIIKHVDSIGFKNVSLITREEVLKRDEDLLEQLEVKTLQNGLQERGISCDVKSVGEAQNIAKDRMGLLLNVDTRTQEFTKLLNSSLQGANRNIYPDPFLVLAKEEMTGYKRVALDGERISQLRALTREVDKASAEKVFVQLMALDNYLNRLGLTDEVFHLYVSSQPTPIPCFRYDIRSFQIASNYIREDDQVEIRSIPINPEKAVLFNSQKRPVYCVFRIMAYQDGAV